MMLGISMFYILKGEYILGAHAGSYVVTLRSKYLRMFNSPHVQFVTYPKGPRTQIMGF